MLSNSELERGIRALAAHYGEPLTDVQVAAHVRALRGWFENAYDWEFAVQEGIAMGRMPSPRQLIDAVWGTVEERAIREFDDPETYLSAVGRRALRSIGGWHSWRTGERERLKEEFVRAYRAYARGAGPEDFKPVGIPTKAGDLPAAGHSSGRRERLLDGPPDEPFPEPVWTPPALFRPTPDEELGIERRDPRAPYTRWQLLLHRWWGACKFGDEQAQARVRQMARVWGREDQLPPIEPLRPSASQPLVKELLKRVF